MQIPASLTASALTEDPSRPSVPFRRNGKETPVQPQTQLCHIVARPPIPAPLAALIGCTAGCQTTDWLLPTIFGCVLGFHDSFKKKKTVLTAVLSLCLEIY